MTKTELALADLYLEDETAWLDLMAERIRAGERSDLDYPNLAEFLTDMARRDRKGVKSRLVALLAHILKWVFQSDRRSRSWQRSIVVQQLKLADDAKGGVLRQYAEFILPEAYADAVKLAATETGLSRASFPSQCAYSLDDLLNFEATEESE